MIALAKRELGTRLEPKRSETCRLLQIPASRENQNHLFYGWSFTRVFKGLLIVIVFICILYPFSSLAGMDAEIDYLLAFIEGSDCTFIRNGKSHENKEAGAHIRRKYGHIKNRVKTTEDFIQYAATKSSMSGQPYQVICNGEKMATADWLTRELDRFRNRND